MDGVGAGSTTAYPVWQLVIESYHAFSKRASPFVVEMLEEYIGHNAC